jgi:hypothetical protein
MAGGLRGGRAEYRVRRLPVFFALRSGLAEVQSFGSGANNFAVEVLICSLEALSLIDGEIFIIDGVSEPWRRSKKPRR